MNTCRNSEHAHMADHEPTGPFCHPIDPADPQLVANLRDCLQRAELARGRSSQLAWMQHAEHAARKLDTVGGWRGWELADRLDYLRRFYEPSALTPELHLLRRSL